ncbi:MAG: CcmD family protein [Bilophila sp.]
MNELNWLMYANSAVWIGLGVYLIFVARAQKALNHRLTQLETLHND